MHLNMSIINRFLSVVTEPQFKLARDLTAMAIADGQVTPEEKEAISIMCHLEGVDETKLMESLQGNYNNVQKNIPTDRRGREDYLKTLIKILGADEYAAPQEIYLFQIIASKMGLNQMEVMGIILSTANRHYFRGDVGSKVLHSFLKNCIDPKGKNEADNRRNLSIIYDTVAAHTEVLQDVEADRELLRQNLERATETFMENQILIKEFRSMNLDFACMLKEEELRVLKKYL